MVLPLSEFAPIEAFFIPKIAWHAAVRKIVCDANKLLFEPKDVAKSDDSEV